MTLKEFFELIDKREYIPGIYIVRLEYKFVYEDKPFISNEILQYDPGYRGIIYNPKYPWYHELWLWYWDWYMCVDPSSVKVLKFAPLDDVFNNTQLVKDISDFVGGYTCTNSLELADEILRKWENSDEEKA